MTIKLAVTIDDMFMWEGMPAPEGHTPQAVAQKLTEAFAAHAIKGVYGFSNTIPVEIDRTLTSVFDHWAETGHYTANHTHAHASLNWVTPDAYIGDIERTEEIIGQWSAAAPKRYFRYCMDMWGDTPQKQEAVQGYLKREGYTPAPVSLWFHDVQWVVPYWRAYRKGDEEAIRRLRTLFVEAAVTSMKNHAALSERVLGRAVPHIWLVHGTPIGGDCASAILDAFASEGVEFITLDEAMADPVYNAPVAPTPKFLSMVERWAEAAGVAAPLGVEELIYEAAGTVPMEGKTTDEIFLPVLSRIAERLGGTFSPLETHMGHKIGAVH